MRGEDNSTICWLSPIKAVGKERQSADNPFLVQGKNRRNHGEETVTEYSATVFFAFIGQQARRDARQQRRKWLMIANYNGAIQ